MEISMSDETKEPYSKVEDVRDKIKIKPTSDRLLQAKSLLKLIPRKVRKTTVERID